MSKATIIGSGFSSLAAATCLADAGVETTVLEKNATIGGRARQFSDGGFVFDMGPSWYWMPDVFEKYFARFGKQCSDYYSLSRLDPSYQVVFEDETIEIPADYNALESLFESREKGAGLKLRAFLEDAAYKYEVGINDLVYKPGLSVFEFLDWRVIKGFFQLDLFKGISSVLNKSFKDPKLLSILEFPVLFLGAKPSKTPALYSLMNYADLKLGTWYPQGGMHKIVEGMEKLALEKGVQFKTNEAAKAIHDGNKMRVDTDLASYESDVVVAGADYHHVESTLLQKKQQQYSETYWENRTMAPSCLLFYLGIDKKVDKLLHHNLFFDADFNQHATEIYDTPQWPSRPLFYACCPSKSDASVAPEGKENIFLLVPVATGLKDTEEIRDLYFDKIMNRLEKHCGQPLRQSITVKRSYAYSDFVQDYNSFKGNAYGLANTLKQTAILKPRIQHKTIKNLFYTGQLTNPGPGVPPALISGQMVADYILEKNLKTTSR